MYCQEEASSSYVGTRLPGENSCLVKGPVGSPLAFLENMSV